MYTLEFDTGWAAGVIESKGVFTVNKIKFKRETRHGTKTYQYINPAFYLVGKDRSALEAVKNTLNIGKVNRHGAIFHLSVRRKTEVIRLAEFLEGKLRSEHKTEQFWRWKAQVLEWKSRAWGAGRDQNQVQTDKLAKGF